MLLLLLACSSSTPEDSSPLKDTTLGPRGDCNPVNAEHCLTPFPSSFYLKEDSSTGTGFRVDFGPTSLAVDVDGTQIAPDYWNEKDGFSILGPIYALLPGAASTGLIAPDAIDGYLADDARTVILNTTTGERVPHFAELEAFHDDDQRRALILHPVVPLDYNTRYVIGVRGVVGADGSPLPAPAGFAVLQGGAATDDDDLERQRASYEDVIFPTLDAAGFARDELQLAWDFVTVSPETSLQKMVMLRDEALVQSPAYTIDSVTDADCSAGQTPGRLIYGHMTTTNYLTGTDTSALLTRDADGMPYANGEVDVPFSIVVPCSVLQNPAPARIVQFGHGLFGSYRDTTWDSNVTLAENQGYILFGTSWKGMSDEDVDPIIFMILGDMSNFAMIGDRLHQGQFEALQMATLMRGAMTSDPNLMVGDTSLIDPEQFSYYGVSLGSVLGGAQVAMSPHVDNAAMQIPGMPFSLLLTRSDAFTSFLMILQARLEDPMDVSLLLPLAQMLWDPVEAGGWAPYLANGAEVGGVDGRRFLFQDGIGDATVTTLGAHVFARTVGAGLLQPAPREVWGLADVESGATTGSALTEWDYGYVESNEAMPQDVEENPHYIVPWTTDARQQIATFFNEGVLENPCDGVCDPE